MEELINLISNYIFPVAMCLILVWKMERDQDRYRQDLNTLREVIEKNTEIMNEIKGVISEMR